MPSKQVYDKLLNNGYRVDLCHFSRYDSLETENDLSALCDVLASVHDKYGHPAVLTANSVVANPDFVKIKENNFSKYCFESVLTSYEHQAGCEHSMEIIRQGMNEGVWHPQSHGREHLNAIRWMKALQSNDEIAHLCFEDNHFSLTTVVSPKVKARYMDAFANANPNTFDADASIASEGLDMFKELYGFCSESFIAPCYTWRSELENVLFDKGVRYIQGLAYQQLPVCDEPVVCKSVFHKLGDKNSLGQMYLVRNAFFEPYKGMLDWTDECMHRIDIAFKCRKPAIISSHRLNFIGSLDKTYRDKNIKAFQRLLHGIVGQWPDVEFVSSDTLGHIIDGK